MLPFMSARKKLIEVALPLDDINAASAREKSIRHGHPSTLHLWWARRPLATARAVLFAQLVDDPDNEHAPREFVEACRTLLPVGQTKVGKHAAAEDTPRHRLFDFIAQLVQWESTTSEAILKKAHELILLSTEGNPPPVLDPFSGGATIPLEAQRLGLEAHGSDLNPVAVMIGKASIEIPPRFAGMPPVHPTDQPFESPSWKGAQGLAEDVRYYGAWMKAEAEKRISYLYPKAKLPDGSETTVIAWLWARTVKCPNPACGADMQLVSSFELSTKVGKKAWVEPEIDRSVSPPRVKYHIGNGSGTAPEPPKTGRGAKFRCLCCGVAADDSYIKAQGRAGQMGAQLMATVAEGARGRIYLEPTEEMEAAARVAVPDWKPDQPMPKNPRWFSPPEYGMPLFSDVFTNRQLVALTTFSDLVSKACEQVHTDAITAGLLDDDVPLRNGGRGARAYGEAIAVYLGLGVSRLAAANCSLAIWKASMDQSIAAFGRQALAMTWDFSEANPLAGWAGDFSVATQTMARVAEKLPVRSGAVELQMDAGLLKTSDSPLISTDPPYYDNIGYSDLSDFFYVWLRRSLRPIFPNILSTLLTPKDAELVANPYRHGGKSAAEKFFMDGMTSAMSNMATQGNTGYPTAIYYAFKQADSTDEGTSSTGWSTFLEAVIQAGFSINGTWPVRSELTHALKAGVNALASSIVLVCRPRPSTAPLATRAEFTRELRRELPEALKALTTSNIAPVDMAQASIGPGMGVFSRYTGVLEPDGSRMSVKAALQVINRELDEFFNEQEGHLDEYTNFAVKWFETHGMNEAAYGEAELLATARGVSVPGVVAAGILEAKAGRARLRRRDELPADWDPHAERPTAWEAVQHLIRALDSGGEARAGEFLAKLGDLGDAARDLAYRLYQICERKGWAQEAQPYNALVASWNEASRAARDVRAATPTQVGLFGD